LLPCPISPLKTGIVLSVNEFG